MTDIVTELEGWVTDFDGTQMKDDEPPRDGVTCGLLRRAAVDIQRMREFIRTIAMTSQNEIAIRRATSFEGAESIYSEKRD